MKKMVSIIALLLALSAVLSACGPETNEETNAAQTKAATLSDGKHQALYKGIEGYGQLTAEDVQKEGFAGYQFVVNGTMYKLPIQVTENFAIQNMLQEDETFTITITNGVVTNAEYINKIKTAKPLVAGVPGEKTLKNFIKTAMGPIGSTLYVAGGGWDWTGKLSGNETMIAGLPYSWARFFTSQNENYNYKFKVNSNNETENHEGTYPFGGYNQYHYVGLDAGGYMGWILYNINNTESSTDPEKGYVMDPTLIAKTLADKGWGTFSHSKITKNTKIKAGDIISLDGNMWISLGICTDGSILLIQCAVCQSKMKELGGGVMLAAINPSKTGEKCEAYKLAETYNKRCYLEWQERYGTLLLDYNEYTNVSAKPECGLFSWNTKDGLLTDSDNVAGMRPKEVLQMAFTGAK